MLLVQGFLHKMLGCFNHLIRILLQGAQQKLHFVRLLHVLHDLIGGRSVALTKHQHYIPELLSDYCVQ